MRATAYQAECFICIAVGSLPGDAIRACTALIAVIDPKYCSSDFCKGELWMVRGEANAHLQDGRGA
jgi:hypothetical protein